MIPVYFIVTRRIVLLDLAGPAEVFRSANLFSPAAYDVHYCAASDEVETGLAGLYLAHLEPLPERLPPNALIVMSGLVGDEPDWRDAELKLVVRWLKRHGAAEGVTMMAVCAGALLAAAAGLLNGKDCTTHHACLTELAKLEPAARIYDNRIFVEDGALFTSAGITAGIDLALFLVSRALGPRVASAVARHMVVYMRRAGQDPALSPWLEGRNHLHPGVHRVQDAILQDPSAPWSAATLAACAHTSPRHLNRLFVEHVGCTSMEYLNRIRLTLASELVRETRMGFELVAERSGFSSAHHLRRVWRRHTQGTLADLRAERLD